MYQSAVHVGVKHPCRQCNYQATTKSDLAQHQREYMRELNIQAGNATLKQLQSKILLSTEEPLVMVPSDFFLLGAITNGAQQIKIFRHHPAIFTLPQKMELENNILSRPPLYMKEANICAGNVNIKQQPREILLSTNGQYRK